MCVCEREREGGGGREIWDTYRDWFTFDVLSLTQKV